MLDNVDKLAALILQQRDALLARWRQQVKELPSAKNLDVPALNDHIPGLLDELVSALRVKSDQTIPEALIEGSPPAHGLQRLQEAFDLEEVVAEYNILRGCIHDLAQANGLTLQGAPFHILNRVLDGAIGLAVKTFAAARALEVRSRREEYLSFVAHDLRTPLTRFRNVAEHALVSDDPAAIREGLGRALEEADRVNATLNALIDISEAETGTMRLAAEPVDVKAVVEEAVALYADEADEKRISLEMKVPSGLTLTGDRTRLRQVVANLIENAVKYTDGGGHVEIDAAAEDAGIRVRVRDTGIGISESDLPLVWDRLYRADASRSARGLGLGLSLVKAVVEAHGGHVSVTSSLGQGSTFVVSLPADAGVARA